MGLVKAWMLTALGSVANTFASLVPMKMVVYIAVSMVLVMMHFATQLVQRNLPARKLLLYYYLWEMGMVVMMLMAGLALALNFPGPHAAVLAARRVVVLSAYETDYIADCE